MKRNWQRLNQEDVQKILDNIHSSEFDELFKGGAKVEVNRADLPFYQNYALYKFTTYASMPSISLEFLGDGTTFYYLDGAPDPIYYVNEKAPIQLTKETVLDYLTFFFDKVEGIDGDIRLIVDPENSPFMSGMDEETKRKIAEHYHGVRVSEDAETNRYTVITPTYFEGSMVEASIAVTKEGNLDLLDHKMLFQMFGGVDLPSSANYL